MASPELVSCQGPGAGAAGPSLPLAQASVLRSLPPASGGHEKPQALLCPAGTWPQAACG